MMDTDNIKGNYMEQIKYTVDVVSLTTITATFFGWLPEISASAGLIWTLIRIYETKTIQGILLRRRKKTPPP